MPGIGDGVPEFAIGDRVAWTRLPGGYVEQITIPADRAVPVPDGVELEVAAYELMGISCPVRLYSHTRSRWE